MLARVRISVAGSARLAQPTRELAPRMRAALGHTILVKIPLGLLAAALTAEASRGENAPPPAAAR